MIFIDENEQTLLGNKRVGCRFRPRNSFSPSAVVTAPVLEKWRWASRQADAWQELLIHHHVWMDGPAENEVNSEWTRPTPPVVTCGRRVETELLDSKLPQRDRQLRHLQSAALSRQTARVRDGRDERGLTPNHTWGEFKQNYVSSFNYTNASNTDIKPFFFFSQPFNLQTPILLKKIYF